MHFAWQVQGFRHLAGSCLNSRRLTVWGRGANLMFRNCQFQPCFRAAVTGLRMPLKLPHGSGAFEASRQKSTISWNSDAKCAVNVSFCIESITEKLFCRRISFFESVSPRTSQRGRYARRGRKGVDRQRDRQPER